MPCNLCKSNSFSVVYPSHVAAQEETSHVFRCTSTDHGTYYQLVRCSDCGLCYSSPRPAGKDLLDLYTNVCDETYAYETAGRLRTFERNLRHLNAVCNRGKVMDVGCSTGVFLRMAKDDGWTVRGLEPSPWCVEHGRAAMDLSSEEILVGASENLIRWDNEYDAVTLWDVLEHLDDPLQTLTNVRTTLKHGGTLMISTMDFGSLYARFLKTRWPWLMRMHIYYFDRSTISRYLAQCGYRLRWIRTYRHTVSLRYLAYKLASINKMLSVVAKGVQGIVGQDRDAFVTFAMGDFMEVCATKE